MKHVAFARNDAKHKDIDAIKAILKTKPYLLWEASDVMTPSGDKVLRVTPYEYALGAEHPELAELIASYFTKVPKGNEEKARQDAHYKPYIDNMMRNYYLDDMLAEADFDFYPLIKILKKSNRRDVTAALNLEFTHESPLQQALELLRIHFSPRMIKTGIHFNYANLLKAFEVYFVEYDNLLIASGYDATGSFNKDKCNLFWRQVIGFIQRSLPACDRQVFAQSIGYLVSEHEPLRRSFDFRFGGGSFPITSGEDPRTGLGYEYAVMGGGLAYWHPRTFNVVHYLMNLRRGKILRLTELIQQHPKPETPGCVIC